MAAGAWLLVSLSFATRAETLRVGYQKSAVALVVLKQNGDLARALAPTDVQWVQFSSGPPMMEAMNAAAIDIGYTGESPPIFAQAAGVDLVYLSVLPVSGVSQGVLVRRDSSPRTLADLRGRRVAFTKGSSAHYALLQLLATARLAASDIQEVYLAPAEAREALDAGSVDAWVIWDPFFAMAQQDPALRTLTDARAAPSGSYVLGRRAYVVAHQPLILRCLASIKSASAWAEQHKAQVAGLLTAVTGVNEAAEEVSAARASYRYADMDKAAIARQQLVADLFAAAHVIPGPVDVAASVWTPKP